MKSFTTLFSTLKKRVTRSAVVISLLYFSASLIWIVASDSISLSFVSSGSAMIAYQTYKGLFFVTVTSMLLFMLVNRQVRRREALINLLKHQNSLLTDVLKHQPGFNVLMVDEAGVIIQAYGDGRFWDGCETRPLTGQNIKNWKGKKEERVFVSRFIKTLMLEGEAEFDGVLGSTFFRFSGFIVNDWGKGKLALVMIQDNSREQTLIADREKFADRLTGLSAKLYEVETLLACSQNKHKEILNTLDEGVIIWKLSDNGRLAGVEDFSQVAARYLNLPSINGKSLEGIFHNSFNSKEIGVLARNNFFNRRQLFTTGLKRGDAMSGGSLDLCSRLIYANGQPRVISTIKENNSSAGQLTASGTQWHDLIGRLSVGVMLITPDSLCSFINQPMKELLGIGQLATINQNQVNFKEIKTDVDLISCLETAFQGKISEEARYKLQNSGEVSCISSFYPVFNENGSVGSVLCLTRAAGIDRLMPNHLDHEQHTQPGVTNPLKPVLLSSLSHELLTPMNGIIGFVELLENENLTESQSLYLKQVRQGSENLLLKLESLLRVAAIENDQVNIENTWFDPVELISEIKDYAELKCNQDVKSNLVFNTNFAQDGLPAKIFNDRPKLIEIMKHLVDSMLNVTGEGLVEFGISMIANHDLALSIRNGGTGNKITDNFNHHSPPVSSNGVNGSLLHWETNLGRNIVEGLLTMLGGELNIEKFPGGGSRWVVTLPLRFNSGVNGNGLLNAPDYNNIIKVLVVQYGFQNIKQGLLQLGLQKIEIMHVNNGADAIEAIHNHKNIALMFCDTRLTDMEGIELMHVIRRISPEIHIVAQAPFKLDSEKRRCLAEGFDDYLVKPVDIATYVNRTGVLTQRCHN